MKYDFTSVIDRRGWDAIAVDAVYEAVSYTHLDVYKRQP